MKNSILLMLCCFFYLSLQVAWAQDYKLAWGNADIKTEKLTPIRIAGKDKTGIYVYAKLGSIEHLVKYDLNMNYLWSTSLELKNSKNKVLDHVDLILTANKIILFTSDFDKVTKSKYIYATYISQSGVVDQKYQLIHTFQKTHLDNEIYTRVNFFKKESLIIITASEIRTLPNGVVDMYPDQNVYIDENLKVKEAYKVNEPEIENAVYVVSTEAPGSFLGVYLIIDDSKDDIQDIGNEFHLVFLDEQTKEQKKYKLDIGEYTIADVNLMIDSLDNRYAILFGYYFDKTEMVLVGTYSIKIDLSNKKIESTLLKPFDTTFLNLVSSITIANENSNASDKQKNKAILKDYEFINLLINKNGEEVLIHEQYDMSFFSNGTSSSNTYYFKDVLITAFDSTGNRKWTTIIPKYQKTYQQDLGSIYTFTYKDEVYVIYKDNAANGTSLSPERYVAGDLNTSALVCVKIDVTGQMKKSIIMPTPSNKTGMTIKPEWMELIDNEVFLMSFQDGNYKIGKIILE